MEKFTAWMEKHFVPIAAKIGSQKHLVAIRDGFIGIMPITMAGAVATLLNVPVADWNQRKCMVGNTGNAGHCICIFLRLPSG